MHINSTKPSINVLGKFLWVPLTSDEADQFLSSRSSVGATKSLTMGNLSLIQIKTSSFSQLRDYMHMEKDCDEFGIFDSFVEAKHFISKLEIENHSKFDAPDIDNYKVAKVLRKHIHTRRMSDFLNLLVGSFKNRYLYSKNGMEAADLIYKEWSLISSLRKDIEVIKYKHPGFEQNSVILTIPGTVDDKEIVILGAHLDSIRRAESDIYCANKPSRRKIKAPGADDNASGVTVLTEAISTLIDTDYRPQKTIQFMAYALEECELNPLDPIYSKGGSRQIAAKYKKEGKNVIGMINFDMVGYHNKTNEICLESGESTNKDQDHFLKELMEHHMNDMSFKVVPKDCFCSDHVSWTLNGFPASYLVECERSPHYHSETDIVENVDILLVRKYAQVAVVYIAEAAKGTT